MRKILHSDRVALFLAVVLMTLSALVPRMAYADPPVISLECGDQFSLYRYDIWVDLTKQLLTYQPIENGQLGASQTLEATITPTEISTPNFGIQIDRTTGLASFRLNGTQEMYCHVSNIPLPAPQRKF